MRRIDEVMTAAPLMTIAPTAAVSEVLRRMADGGVSHLVVLDGGRLVGIVCACDLETADLNAAVGEHMTGDPLTLMLGTSAFSAARCMLEQGVSCLPVLSDGVLAGIVTLSDLQRAGVLERAPSRCAACGDDDHVRCSGSDPCVGFCLQCRRSSLPPAWDDDLGGG